jgi:hypothetical protein
MSRLLARLQRAELERQSQAAVRKALAESDPGERKGAPTAGGDAERLRGIPVVGARGVGGAIRGSKPGANLR